MFLVLEGGLRDLPAPVEHWQRLFELAQGPLLSRLEARFYATTELAAAETAGLSREVESARLLYRERRIPELVRERQVRARDPQVASTIVEGFLAQEPFHVFLTELIELCRDAEDLETGLLCVGD